MKYKLGFIVLSITIMIGAVLFIAHNRQNQLFKTFIKDGYVLSFNNKSTTNSSVKYYFENGTKYKSKYSEKIIFTDIDGNEVNVDNNNILHYLDGSISFLKKSVIVNTDELSDKNLKYYNIFEDKIMEKHNAAYYVTNGDKRISFTNFIIKVSDSKYLISSPNLKLVTSESTREFDSYLELNIIDGNIIRLENQEVSLQTVSSDVKIFLNDNTLLDLSNNKIYYNNEEKFSLSQLVIDSDDNIPLIPDDEVIEDDKDEEDNNTGGSIIDVGDNEYDEEIEEDIKNLPTFSITDMDVTSNKMSATIVLVDDDNMLMGNVYVKIIENQTGKTVYMTEESTGSYILDVTVENLSPNNSYTLVMNSEYIKEGIVFNRDFLIKNFRTELIGIYLEKDYFTTTSLSFKLSAESYSKVRLAEVLLINNKNEIIKRVDADINEAKAGLDILFDSLTPNTEYKIIVTNFLYEDIVIADGYEIVFEASTLKNRPTFGDVSSIIDKKNGVFTLKPNRVSDVDNGIVSFKYEVYDARLITDPSVPPITVIEKDSPTSIDIPVDEVSIFRGVPYSFKLVADFHDNEKHIEYESEFSSVFKMDGVEFPTVRFDATNVTFERIEGNLIIVDNGNTISFDNNIITVVYTNSIGHSKSFTTSGNLSIPVSINNLRANETYVISVYTRVNLQDGNPPIDSCYIGSAIVKTEEPADLFASMNVNSDSVTNAFLIETTLNGKEGYDNLLEANTLTGLIFNLYAGKSTNGPLVKSVRKVDRKLAPYVSDLKELYYDNYFNITPEFFGVSNSDMHEEFYTIEISRGYDYTDYENVIQIQDRVVTVESNGFIPDLPSNPSDALEVAPIRNKDAGDRYRSDLKAETIVGYKVRGSYDNSRLYAKYLKYYIYDARTNNVLDPDGVIVSVDDTGIIHPHNFYLEDGTNYNSIDHDFRRGNEYYFTYEAYLDLNQDGIAETKYPQNNIILKSDNVQPLKQEPEIKMYPSLSTSNSMKIKYMVNDVDSAMVEDVFYNKINGSERSLVNIQKNSNDYLEANLTNLIAGDLLVETELALIKDESYLTRRALINQHFDSVFNMKTLSFHTVVDTNRLIISILDYDANINYIKRISALKVTMRSGSKVVVKDNVPLDDDLVVIDLAELKDLINENITVEVEAYYDSGITGFDIKGSKLALQNILTSGLGGNYLTINNQNNLREDFIASGSIYNITHNPTNLVLENLSSNLNKTINTVTDNRGIMHNYEYLIPKKLELSKLNVDGSEVFSFDNIVPGVSLLDDNGRLNISSTLRTASVYLKFYGADASQIRDNEFYIELYETDESGITSKLITTEYVKVSGINYQVDFNNLNPKTEYFIKVFADVHNGSDYIKTQLYDVDFQTNTKIHYFSTLSGVGITNTKVNFEAINYNTKNISISYNLDEIVGYDKINYKLYEHILNEDGILEKVEVDTHISDDIIFKRTMVKKIPCPPGSGFNFDTDYTLVITPIAYITVNGEQVEIELDDIVNHTFHLEQLLLPFVGVMGTATDDLGLEFKISIADINKIIVNGTYTIKILNENGNDITPDEYKYTAFPINTLNNIITIVNLERATTYTLVVTTYIDRDNNLTNIERYESQYQKTTLDDSGIDIGDLYTAMNFDSKSKIDLLFYNSYKLTYITEIRYSIYNFGGFALNGTDNFIPTQVTSSAGNYYLFTLPEVLAASGIYHVELQFLYEGRIVKTATKEHNYITS